MMEAASTSETLVNFYQTTRRYNPEDSHLHNEMLVVSSVLSLQIKHSKFCCYKKKKINTGTNFPHRM
jgi:hypothetical protein